MAAKKRWWVTGSEPRIERERGGQVKRIRLVHFETADGDAGEVRISEDSFNEEKVKELIEEQFARLDGVRKLSG